MPSVRISPNQVIAYNLWRARQMHGWTQETAAERLEPFLGERWSKATFSVAERSLDHPERIRQFTADDIVAFAAAFELPLSFFFTPPQSQAVARYRPELIAAQNASEGLTPEALIELATSSADDRVAALTIERLEGLGLGLTAGQMQEAQRGAGLSALREGRVKRGPTDRQTRKKDRGER